MRQWHCHMGTIAGLDECEDHPASSHQYKIRKEMEDPVAYAASMNPDIIYVHEVMKVPYCDQFWKAMDKELDDHISCEHWEVILKEDIPKGTKLLDMVWAMCRKRHIDMREVYKWKARLMPMMDNKFTELTTGKLMHWCVMANA